MARARAAFSSADLRRAERVAASAPQTVGALAQVAERVAASARRNVPVATGRLRRSIRVVLEPGPDGPRPVVVAGGGRTFYAGKVEYGTARTPPRAFMRRAAAETGRFSARPKGS